MGILSSPIRKAMQRGQSLDLADLVDNHRTRIPLELTGALEQQQRATFLVQSLGAQAAPMALERILAGNELQDVNYLSRGARAAMAVGRITAPNSGGSGQLAGTGFIIAPGVLITNNHVLASAAAASQAFVDFNYQLDDENLPSQQSTYRIEPDRLFFTVEKLDFTVVAVNARSVAGAAQDLDYFGCLPLLANAGKAVEGEWLTIVQHPEGKLKMVCVRENQLLKRVEDVLWYSSDTQGGSSGAPVFNNDWFVVALHHSGVPEMRDGRVQTRDGQDHDPAIHSDADIKWVANEGIRATRIIETLQIAKPDEPLLAPLFAATPHSARIAESVPLPDTNSPMPQRIYESTTANVPLLKGLHMSRIVQVTLRIDENGHTTVLEGRAPEAAVLEAAKAAPEKKKPKVKVKFDDDYGPSRRKGFKSDILDKDEDKFFIHRPELTPAKQKLAAPHIDDPEKFELDYLGYTVVMNAKRRLAMYSAASIDFEKRSEIDSRTDIWRSDPRILDEHQLDDSYYEKKRPGRLNQFDKGHLTRNEDMEYGSNVEKAAERAVDTFHYTNRAPQHANFNRVNFLWQDLELHILEGAIKADRFRAQVITGPVLAANDPVFKAFGEMPYPERFWKIAIAINSKNELVAVAFLLDQSGVIAKDGLEAVDELPFKPFREFQVSIAEIERLTGLKFWAGKSSKKSLREYDPLEGKVFSRRRQRGGSLEAAGDQDIPEGYVPLEGLESVILE